jgi:hypothetical protein
MKPEGGAWRLVLFDDSFLPSQKQTKATVFCLDHAQKKTEGHGVRRLQMEPSCGEALALQFRAFNFGIFPPEGSTRFVRHQKYSGSF